MKSLILLISFTLLVPAIAMSNVPHTISNAAIAVSLNSSDGTFSVTDKRTGEAWQQASIAADGVVENVTITDRIEYAWRSSSSDLAVGVTVSLDDDRPEFLLSLSANADLKGPLAYPHPFVSHSIEDYLVVPMNEGISYPVEDQTIETRRLIAYGGHGICMPFWGVTDGERGHMAILETPDDAAIRIERHDGKLDVAAEWDAQKGRFGYDRKLRYIFLDEGGHVAIAKRYRAYAVEQGLVRTLTEKRAANPDVDLLIGAVNVWYWRDGQLDIVNAMKAAGIDRILWSHRAAPDVIEAMNGTEGVLTSRYDIYQDLMDPEMVAGKLSRLHPDWTQEAWPHDLMLDERSDPRKGWEVKGSDGVMYPCGVLCDRQALPYARERISDELKTHPYRSRFIDTTTASPWRECYHPDHPMTRSESRHWKMELLRCVSEEMGLVTGCETGHDASIPWVHYFEGMLSLGPYRVPDSGRNLQDIVEDVPERVAKYQLGQQYRLPLFELVYHDCVVSQWYWGDYNNKLPALWDKRDLFNLLYGTVPMFMFTKDIWEQNADRFIQSYQNVCPTARAVGYAEMVDHRFLTTDRDVQQTIFSNGISVTVNFGNEPHILPGGETVASMGTHVEGI